MVDYSIVNLRLTSYKNMHLQSESFSEEQKYSKPVLNRALIVNMIWCLGLSLFWVVFLWRFWDKGPYALGINATIFFIVLLALFIRSLYYSGNYSKKDIYWLIPLAIIPFSYLFYDNPFIKTVNLLVYPFLTSLFIHYGFLKDKNIRYWGINFLSHFIARFFSFLKNIPTAFSYYIDMFIPKSGQKRGTMRRVVIGAILLSAIALIVIIPLLSSADPVFGNKLNFIYDFIKRYIAESVLAKALFFFFFSLFLFSVLLAWARRVDYPESKEEEKRVDSIISGIVLGGILAIYLLFLWVQIERLWVNNLPIEFSETEELVKSGFWQLFFLSGLNALFYFFTYRKTGKPVQKILTAFTMASFLLLVSAGWRMTLYVVNYGFSYEKFFASYTVIFSAVLFIWLLACLFRQERANVFKFIVFLFLWMYALITVIPVEQFIMRSNASLANRSESRINLYELTMLSPDVLGLVKKYQSEGKLKEDWQPWIDKQEKQLVEKRWYEFNF